ncbi:insulin-like growth factor binding protein [Anaeramoeba flamelloides]|uniref:Insulin-like growth factor binding protein n=1 Tax=Anaeramoeba flamelloides TaxID=1746091 RepID=A0ABQ8Y3V4_9EUKA|nr:insulin-like growth factor binding protein [Anaeramoeba flamelloides]
MKMDFNLKNFLFLVLFFFLIQSTQSSYLENYPIQKKDHFKQGSTNYGSNNNKLNSLTLPSFITQQKDQSYVAFLPMLGQVNFYHNSTIIFTIGNQTLQLVLVNSSLISPQGFNQQAFQTNFLQKESNSNEIHSYPSYQSIRYPQIWEGVDLVFHLIGSKLKSEFECEDLASFKKIQYKYRFLNPNNLQPIHNNYRLGCFEKEINIVDLKSTKNEPLLIENQIIAFQDDKELEIFFRCSPENIVSFEFNKNVRVNENQKILVDPSYASYFGDSEHASHSDDFVIDGDSVILLGSILYRQYPFINTTMGACNQQSVILSKIKPDGTNIEWVTLIGSDQDDFPDRIISDKDGNLIFSGLTLDSLTYPLTNSSYFSNCSSYAKVGYFITKISKDGTNLLQSMIICSNSDRIVSINSMNIHEDNFFYISGLITYGTFETCSATNITNKVILIKMSTDLSKLYNVGCYQLYNQLILSNVLKFDPDGNTVLVGSSKLNTLSNNNDGAGAGGDIVDVDVDADADVNDLPGYYFSCFIMKINSTDLNLIWKEGFGGSGEDKCISYDIDSNGDVWVVGFTLSTDFQTSKDAFMNSDKFDVSGFLVQYANDGSMWNYSTLIHSLSDQAWNTAETISISEDQKYILVCGKNYLEQLWFFLNQIYSNEQYWDYCIVFDRSDLSHVNTTISIKYEQGSLNTLLQYNPDNDQNKYEIFLTGTSENIITTEYAYKRETKKDNAFVVHIQGCSVGTSGNSLFDCNVCKKGSYNFKVDQKYCTPCKKGTRGTYGLWNKMRECESCTIGHYQNKTGQTACELCPVGRYTDVVGATICKTCQKGSYTNVTKQSACIDCNPGYYMDKTGQSHCKQCSHGTIASKKGQSQCVKCNFFKEVTTDQTKCQNSTKKILIVVFPSIIGLALIIGLIIWRVGAPKKKKNQYIPIQNINEDEDDEYSKQYIPDTNFGINYNPSNSNSSSQSQLESDFWENSENPNKNNEEKND